MIDETDHVFPDSIPLCLNNIWIAEVDVDSLSDGEITITVTHVEVVKVVTVMKTSSEQAKVAITSVPLAINGDNYQSSSFSGTCHYPNTQVVAQVGIAGNLAQAMATVDCQSDQTWMVEGLDLTAVDESSNVLITVKHGPATAVATVIKDTMAPAAPGLTLPSAVDMANAGTYMVSGTCEAGVTVMVTVAGRTNHPTCSAEGTWTATLDMTGIVVVQVQVVVAQRDMAGNLSEEETADADVTHHVAIDPPAADINIATGSIYTLRGTCTHNGQEVVVTLGRKNSINAATCTAGAWTADFTVSGIDDGDRVEIQINHSTVVTPIRVTIQKDTMAPVAP